MKLSDHLVCIICGLEHTGTSLLVNILQDHKDIFRIPNGTEMGLLTPPSPRQLFDDEFMYWANIAVRTTRLSSQVLREVCDCDTFAEMYQRLGEKLNIDDKRIIDKKPSYVHNLMDIAEKSEDVPIFITRKTLEGTIKSHAKRGKENSKTTELFKSAYEDIVPKAIDKYGNDKINVIQYEDFVKEPIPFLGSIFNRMGNHVTDGECEQFSRNHIRGYK